MKQGTPMQKNPAAGFSLIELLVAMVITLIIVGSVVGLLTSGQSAFSTQPERTDRQQNLRVAMESIMRDVASGGVGMPNFVQVFTPGLNGVGPGVGVDGASLTDEIEILTNTSGFGPELACHYPGGKSAVVRLQKGKTNVSPGPVLVFFYDGTYAVNYATDVDGSNKTGASGGQVACDSGESHVQLNFNTGGDPSGMNDSKGICQPNRLGMGNAGSGTHGCDGPEPAGPATGECCEVNYITSGALVRYWIERDPQGMPNLWRVENGTKTSDWRQLLARGVEDLQVRYTRSDGVFPATTGTVSDEPVLVAANDYTTLTTQVQVTLSARTTAQRIQGATTIAGDATTAALRGSLVSQASPRQALWVLTQESPAPASPKWN